MEPENEEVLAWGGKVHQTDDGGYIISGWAVRNENENYNGIWLIKTDAEGNMLWDKAFGDKITGEPWEDSSAQQTNDGGYIIISTINEDIWLIKTDSDGDELWNKTFGGSDNDWSLSAQQTTDGGYIIAGYTLSVGSGKSDAWLIKTDSDGNELWNKTFGGSDNDWGFSAQQTTDGGYIIAGNTYSFGSGKPDVWLIKTDANGNE